MLAALTAVSTAAYAQGMPGVVLDLHYKPTARAQIAIWLEDDQGRFIETLGLTEAVAFHGIGNRPGASQLNSGYRWPYGRREGVLPIWAARRAAAPGAKRWQRVIFQNRTSEGLASRTSSDQSPDAYYCLSFTQQNSTRDALDAVSCATPFNSDKGRFLTPSDVAAGYAEPFEDPSNHQGIMQPLPLLSLYPPRMDVTRCSDSGCYDTADVAGYAAHAREVMPEIDAVTMATAPGDTEQSLLFSLPPEWPQGRYALWVEIGVEGDYNDTYSDTSFATPTQPSTKWDSWAISYGYPYRGQPSIAFEVPFTLAGQGDGTFTAKQPVGRSSWDFWAVDYGALQPADDITDDPTGAPGSGADRLRKDAQGNRLSLDVSTLVDLPPPDPNKPLPSVSGGGGSGGSSAGPGRGGGAAGAAAPTTGDGSQAADAGVSAMTSSGTSAAAQQTQRDPNTDAVILQPAEAPQGPVGAIRGLQLAHSPDRLHVHDWIAIRFLAATSEQPLHAYEARVSTDPITDEASFIQNGRPARTATSDAEGSVALMLPTDIAAGKPIESAIGDLVALTHYYVAVRATDQLNRHGPISVAQISTETRHFATVSPCFVASATYGSALAEQVGVLRRLRDRQLLTNRVGRALVRAYYANGASLARAVRRSDLLRSAARAVLEPLVAAARLIERWQ